MFCATLTTFTTGLGPLSLAPIVPQLIDAFNSDLASVLQFTGITILVLGFSNFIWYIWLRGTRLINGMLTL